MLGQNCDRSGRTVRNLRLQTWLLAGLSAALYVVRPDPAYLWVGLVLLAVGSVVSEIAGVNYNATIDQVATTTVVVVSGFGWGMGFGGILVLLLLYFLFIEPEVGLFGVTDADGMDIRVSMPSAASGLCSSRSPPSSCCGTAGPPSATGRRRHVVPARLALDPGPVGHLPAHGVLPARLGAVPGRSRGGVLRGRAAGTFGLSAGDVIVFGAAANIVAGFATMAFGMLDDRIGPKRVILISLGSLSSSGC